MMQKNSDTKAGAIIAASVIVILLSLFVGFFILLMIGINDAAANGILMIYVLLECAVIAGVLIALSQRLKEFKSGEAEDAKKY